MEENEVPKDEGAKAIKANESIIPSSPYSNIKREITEDDLKSPAVQRILLGEIDKLENRNIDLEFSFKNSVSNYDILKDKYHNRDKEAEILSEKLKTHKSQEILYSFCLTSGSIIIGLAKTVWAEYGILFLGIGLFLIIGGIITKAIKWS